MRPTLIAAFLATATAFAQTGPALHSRGSENRGPGEQAAKGFSTLPPEASGEYVLDEHGSVIQITIEGGRLTGYVSMLEDGAALTLFFDKASIHGNRLRFTTKTVHGLRYSFHGVIERGEAAAPSLGGYFLLTGELAADRNGASVTKRVRLKSTPRMP